MCRPMTQPDGNAPCRASRGTDRTWRKLVSHGSDDGHLALYLRLARIFRQHIRAGLWLPGQQIPTLPELCQTFSVSRTPVRQALALLIADGLVSSTSGRGTFVSAEVAPAADDEALRRSISDPFALGPGQTIRVLRRRSLAGLPPEMAGAGPEHPGYTATSKLHSYHGTAFVHTEVFVEAGLAAQIPPGADETQKLVHLLRTHTNAHAEYYRQEVILTHAGPEHTQFLGVALTSTLVRMRRWWLDGEGRVAWAALSFYRGDMFVLDITLPMASLSPLPLAAPKATG